MKGEGEKVTVIGFGHQSSLSMILTDFKFDFSNVVMTLRVLVPPFLDRPSVFTPLKSVNGIAAPYAIVRPPHDEV